MARSKPKDARQDDLFGAAPPPPPPPPPPKPKAKRKPSRPPSPYAEGDALRDAGIDQALDGDAQKIWGDEIIRRITLIHIGWEGTAEQWRVPAEHDGWLPRHRNAWGGIANRAWKKHKLIKPTGEMRKPQDGKSHSREIKVWRRL